MKKKGVILNFSPHRKGNSDFIANRIYSKLRKCFSIEVINVSNLKIKECKGCEDYCTRNGKCKIKDDMSVLYQHFTDDDFLIVVSPIYFYHIPGYSKIAIDRCQPFWCRKYILKNLDLSSKKGFVVLIGATKGKKLFSGVDLTLKYFFDVINARFDKEYNLYLRNNLNLIPVIDKYVEKIVEK